MVAWADSIAVVDSTLAVTDTVAADMAAWVAIVAGTACWVVVDVATEVAVVVADTCYDFLSRVLSQCEYNICPSPP